VACPEYPHPEPQPATISVRPHELDLHRTSDGLPSLSAKLLRLNPAGSVMRVQVLAVDCGAILNVDLPPDRCAQLGLKVGDTVYVTPRRVRVFVPDYVI
jgi:sulfate transport system ATP-binding protein